MDTVKISIGQPGFRRVCRMIVPVCLSLALADAAMAQTAHAQTAPAPNSAEATTQAQPAPAAAAATAAAPTVTPASTTAPIAAAPTVSVTPPPAAVTVHTDLPADLSVAGMFKAADPIVKGVMGLLAAASVATWAIFLYKFIELAIARSQTRADLDTIARSGMLSQVSQGVKSKPVAMLVRSAELEVAASETLPASGVKERVAIALQRIESAAARRIGIGTGVLASVGSTGPFVGLFGTVWGIMNSFIHISNAHTTNLSVVAPGIAEALLATAMGLVAAIPAVVIYNMFSRSIASYRALLGDATAGIMVHVSRDLDRSEQRQYVRLAAE